MTRNGFLAMVVLSLVLAVLGAVAVFAGGMAYTIVGVALVFVGALALVGSAKVRGRHAAEMQRRKDAGELL